MRVSRLPAGLLAVVMAGAALLATPPAAARATTPTRVAITASPPRTVTYRTSVSIQGQVLFREGNHEHAVEGTVVLSRRYLDTSTWRTLGSDEMSGFFPAFDFTVLAMRGAQYRVSFAGDATYGPSAGSVFVRVARRVTATVNEPRENVFVMTGRVSPAYAGRTVELTRKFCASCVWRVYARKAASKASTYRFRLPLPLRGTHFFRVRIPASNGFVTSFSSTWRITRIL